MNHQQIKVLLVEDEPAYAALLQDVLAEGISSPFRLTHAERLSDAAQRLAKESFDVVLLDLSLPDCQGRGHKTVAEWQTRPAPL